MQRDPEGRVLVVDDDEETRAAFRALLERAGGVVEEAAAGDEAVRLAGRQPPAVVVVDISIPGLDGWETTRRLKGQAATRGVPVIAVTGHALDEDRATAREVGCDAYLVKPVPPARLLAEVARLGSRASGERP
jgi:CheY-like chemotaxis protein